MCVIAMKVDVQDVSLMNLFICIIKKNKTISLFNMASIKIFAVYFSFYIIFPLFHTINKQFLKPTLFFEQIVLNVSAFSW